MKIGKGLGFYIPASDKNKEVKTKTIMLHAFCSETNIVNSAATNWMFQQEKQILHLTFYRQQQYGKIIVQTDHLLRLKEINKKYLCLWQISWGELC